MKGPCPRLRLGGATVMFALLALPCAVVATPAAATTASQAIALLNAQRVANGLPAGITENPVWSEGCRLHIAYLVRNRFNIANGVSPHQEDPTRPGYTPEGADAAANAELAWTENQRGEATGGEAWTHAGGGPWEDAPFHLQAILDPDLQTVGYADGCLRDGGGHTRPSLGGPRIFTYPGPGTAIYQSQTVEEGPASPGDFIGLRQPVTTGPTLYAWVLGGAQPVTVVAASLQGPGGLRSIRTVDASTPGAGDLVSPDGVIVIPVRPLTPLARFTATVTLTLGDGSQLTDIWSFTAGPEHVLSTVRAGNGPYEVIGRTTRVMISGGNAVGRRATITYGRGRLCSADAACQVRFTGRTHRRMVRLRKRTMIGIPSTSGTVAIRIQVRSFLIGARLHLATDYGFTIGP
jgi:hypothetical protein